MIYPRELLKGTKQLYCSTGQPVVFECVFCERPCMKYFQLQVAVKIHFRKPRNTFLYIYAFTKACLNHWPFLFGSKHLVKMQWTVSNIKENKIGFYSGNSSTGLKCWGIFRKKVNSRHQNVFVVHISLCLMKGEKDKKKGSTTVNWQPIIHLSNNKCRLSQYFTLCLSMCIGCTLCLSMYI